MFTDLPDRLCVVRLSAIGDCCHLVPVIRTLQTAWPETRITWAMGRMEAVLLGDLDGVECITFDNKPGPEHTRLSKGLRWIADRLSDAVLVDVSGRLDRLMATLPALCLRDPEPA